MFFSDLKECSLNSILKKNNLWGCFICLILIIPFGCEKEDSPYANPDFSVNLVMPGENFPQKKVKRFFTPAQERVVEIYGPPDFLRIWWDRYGNLKRKSEVFPSIENRKYRNMIKSWIYEFDEKEIVFEDKDNFYEQDLTTKLKLTIKYGDPEDVKIHRTRNGEYREAWRFYQAGKIFTLNDKDEIIDEQDFTPMGQFIKN